MASNEMAPGNRHNMALPGQRPNRGVYIVRPRLLFVPDELRLMEERAQQTMRRWASHGVARNVKATTGLQTLSVSAEVGRVG